jgi:alpha-2-macroglobulin
MRNSLLLLTTFMVVIFLSSCNRKVVSLDYTSAKEEVPQLGNLSFRFSKPLVHDSMLNRWDSTAYITFKPAIPGRFRWEHPDELIFSPARPLPPATSFTAEINDEVLEYSDFNKISSKEKIGFRTPDLKLDNVNTIWVLQNENSNQPLPQVDLYFNYPINPDHLKDKLDVQVDGRKTDFNITSLSTDSRISLRLLNVKAADKDLDIKIILGKGLLPENGKNKTEETLESKTAIASPFVLNINDITSEHDGNTGRIIVKTSQQVVATNLATYIRLDPAVKYAVEVTDDGFQLTSEEFDVSKDYELLLLQGLRGRIGGVLKEEYQNNLAFGKLEPSISFPNTTSVYLSAKGAKNIEARLINVPKVKIIISKIYESNLLAAQRHGYYPQESQNNSDESDYYEDGGNAVLGDVIYEKEIDTRSLPKNGNNRLFHFNFEDRLNDFKGMYHIAIRSTEDYWMRESRFISLSDIGLIAKEGREKLVVFANSIKTAAPVDGVNVLVYGQNNQVLGIGATNASGIAEITYSRKEFAGFKPAMIIAKTANDFNYLPFNNTKVNTSRFDVGGKKSNPTGLDAFVYAERDIYRPGERVNFAVILRDQQWKSAADLPVKFKFLMPNGKELKSFRKTLNEQGAAEGSVDISAAGITGSYSLEVYSANDILMANKSFMIEEFVPDRIKVTAKLSKESLRPGDEATFNINAVNFFGPPAANRNYEAEIQIKQKGIYPKRYGRFDFNLTNQSSFFDKVVREGKTDADGNAAEQFIVPDDYLNIGLLQSTFYATVFDETGRPVSRSTSADIYTQPIFLGIGDDGYGYYPLNQTVKFPVIAIDKNEALVNGTKAEVKVIKHEYRTVLSRNGEYFSYQSQKEDKLLSSSMITISGEQTKFSYVPRSPGDYEIRVSLPGANSYISKSFYSYGHWGGSNNSFEVNREGNIDIETDKSAYLTGDNIKLLFKTPFSGKMLITVETDKVLAHEYINVDNRSAAYEMKLTEAHLPNVYITATLIKPHDVSETPLTVAHGFQNIKVEEKKRKQLVAITAEKSVRSRTHQKVTVKAEPNSYVSLAAVDNGVLQISGFETPDPYNFFYAKKALEVSAYDLYPLLFPELRATLSSTGGDGDLEMSKRSNPMPNKRIKVVSYWSGLTKANGDGEAKFEFDIPQFSGQVRLMAVAFKNESFGSAEAAQTVADPLVISTALPRFLSPSDTVSVPVTISNTTSRSTTATASIQVSGPLKIAGSSSQSVQVAANTEGRVIFRLAASPVIDAGKVMITVNGLGEKFTDETDISVRPASTLQKFSGSGAIAGNSRAQLQVGNNDLLPASATYKLVVSRSPVLELGSQLNYLVDYPYGCTEQVISVAFPQLYYGDIAEVVKGRKGGIQSANYNIQEAIRKIKMRQLYNGAVMLWDNDGTENWWATTYAAHFLLEAKKAGYDVEQSLLETLLSYINNRLRNRQTINYYYNRTQQKKIAPKEVAYSLYVLSIAGRPNVSVMNYYKAKPELLALDSRYLLSAAYASAGDKNKFREMLPAAFAGEESVAETGGSFHSDIRDEAIALNVLIDVDPANKQVPVMARHVINKLKQRRWYNTQESAFSFLAVGKLARIAKGSNVTAEIKVNGKTVANASGNIVRLGSKEIAGNTIEISTKGEGRMYYWWESEGISMSGKYNEEDNYLRARRRFFDRYGRAIDGNSFKQNDLVIVQLTLEKSYSGLVNNIVLTDIIPAGFEIENPRTKELPGMEWIKDASNPTQLDVRDDRINLFVELFSSRQTYYYAVRAVSPGLYHMGPVSADAMYNGEYHSYHGAGVIKVTE